MGYSRGELLGIRIPDVDVDPVVVIPRHEQLLSGEKLPRNAAGPFRRRMWMVQIAGLIFGLENEIA